MPVLKPLLVSLFVSFPALAGTWEEVESFEADCTYVPPDTACLSACAFAWLKGANRTNDGIVGFHMPYNLETGETDPLIDMKVILFLDFYGFREYYTTMHELTSKCTFLMFEGDEVFLMSWKDLQGYTIVADTKTVPRCPTSKDENLTTSENTLSEIEMECTRASFDPESLGSVIWGD